MKKKIVILGSTGSIGKSLLEIISKDKKNFKILLLTAKKNYKKLLNQAKKFNVENIIITDQKYYKIARLSNNSKKIKIHNNFDIFQKIFKTKVDYAMSSIVGLEGLSPTIKLIKYSKKIAIANKESIICAWNLILEELEKYKTEFIPVDSEHFSLWYALKNNSSAKIDKIYLTASGGSLLKIPKSKFNNIKVKKILNHPNWKMGKKITIDSSTLMNKVFEIIEAKKIFNLNYKALDIVIHPNSYVHTIIKFSNGMIKIIAHDTTMKIPISNSLYDTNKNLYKTTPINLNKLNNLSLSKVDKQKFTSVKILKKLPNYNSLFETVLVTANDELVKLFLNKKIKYNEIITNLIKIIDRSEFKKFKKILPTKISEVIKINKYVRNKITTLI